MNETMTNEVLRLPLWKGVLEKLREQGVTYGAVFKVEYFEESLRCKRDTMEFGLAMSSIRQELECDGLYISGRGQNGNQFVVLQPENNADVMASYSRAAVRALKRGVILGTNTDISLLNPTDRERHEKMLEKMATRLALISRRSPAELNDKSDSDDVFPKEIA